jgi:hypothetical protein
MHQLSNEKFMNFISVQRAATHRLVCNKLIVLHLDPVGYPCLNDYSQQS